MNIKFIKAINYRCFEDSEFEFGTNATVFIGKNGTGKSSVISAIRKGLSFLFSDSKDEINPLKANNNVSISAIPLLDTRFDEFSGFVWPTSLNYVIEFDELQLSWQFYKKGHPGGLRSSLYRDSKNVIIQNINDNPLNWPLFAFYSDSYPHKEMNMGAKASKIIKALYLPRDFAYYGWESHTNCNLLWEDRFVYIENFEMKYISRLDYLNKRLISINERIDKIHEENEEKLDLIDFKDELIETIEKFKSASGQVLNTFLFEKEFIKRKFQLFTKPISDEKKFINEDFEVVSISTEQVNGKKYSLKYLFHSGKMMFSEMLPMGYKRLFNILMDLAYREFTLTNGKYESRGIAIIDEIELHLHPTLQQEVLQRFKKAFPKLQFIVTTHSPLVISNFKSDENNKIIKLENEGNKYWNEQVDNIYGIDYSTGLTEVMGAKYRASTIDSLIDSIVILTSRNKLEDAEKIKKELFAIVGEKNEYILNEIQNRIEMNKR